MKTINYEDLKKLIDTNADYILIDVREPAEIKKYGAIPTSINIPFDKLSHVFSFSQKEFKDKYGKTFALKTKFIFYCRSGNRSSHATNYALGKGYNAINYSGSANDWSLYDVNVKGY